MKWEFIAQRENDFLKNCLLYESFADNFVRVFGRHHPDYLTVRQGMSFAHYLNKESSSKLAEFVLGRIKKNPGFMNGMHETGKRHFDNLLSFCSGLGSLSEKSNAQLFELMKEYFRLYKEPYPYFMLTVEARVLENENSEIGKEAINTMAKLRFYGRSSYNKIHEIGYPLFEEIAKRFNLSVKELKFLKPSEVLGLLKGVEINVSQLIKDRNHCFFVHSEGKVMLHENALLEIKDDGIEDTEIKGRGTFPAHYRGKVKLIRNIEDIKEIGYGDVIVLQMTTTDLVTEGLEKAGAIITDEGGVTCHAALLSMEMNIPALIGTRIATKVLKDGDIVEIDTGKGTAKKCP